jgi:hypothetical protein
MHKFSSSNNEIKEITFKGVDYFFILDPKGVGIRRQDGRNPKANEIQALTDYIFEEGWADREDFEERESWQDDA